MPGRLRLISCNWPVSWPWVPAGTWSIPQSYSIVQRVPFKFVIRTHRGGSASSVVDGHSFSHPQEAGCPAPAPSRGALREIALLFLRLGATAFGGPAAHIALLEDEVVRRRGWVTRERFLDLLGATNLIPGPNSTEMAIHLGYLRGGPLGLMVAGVCFIVPASLLSAALAWAYVRFGGVPGVEGVLYGIKPAIIVIVVQAVVSLSRAALRTRWLVAIAVGSAAAVLLGVNELLVLGVAGAATCAPRLGRGGRAFLLAVPAAAAAPAAVGLWPLFLAFAKIGSVLFGSGYVLLAFLRADLVAQRHWLTEAQLLDAVAVGQLTP